MNILAIDGSPRKEGTIATLLKIMCTELESAGCDVKQIKVSELNIAPCTGCMSCRSLKKCVLTPDDSLRMIDAFVWADAFLIGAPCYWNNIPGPMKTMFDRMVYALMELSPRGIPCGLHKGKRALIVASSTTPWPINRFTATRGVIRNIKAILDTAGIKTIGSIQKGGTAKKHTLSAAETAKAKRSVHRLITR